MTRFNNEFSLQQWESKHKNEHDNDINDTFDRVSKNLASTENNKDCWTKKFRYLLEDFKFVPGGRILSNAGTGLSGTTYINCFVGGFHGSDKDSIEGIYQALLKQAKTLQSEGGYGFCCSVMRPRGSNIQGIANQSPGAVKFLELWDKSSEIITSGSGQKAQKGQKKFIRKGAQMVTLPLWHPDIKEFITAKQTEGRLSKFNMSVLVCDDFMNCVIKKKNWDLVFPNHTKYSKEYKKHWDGNLEKWKQIISSPDSTVIYETVPAIDLWELIMESTYNRNDPGILFSDTINRMNNLKYCEFISASNPCVSKGTLVNTPKGYKKVETLKSGNLISTVLGHEPIQTVEKYSNVPTFKVIFSDGVEQIVTADHQYHVSRKNSNTKKIQTIKVSELEIGDKIRVNACNFADVEYNKYSEYKYGQRAGVLLGDGCYTNYVLKTGYIKIATNKDDVEYNNNIQNVVFKKDYFNKGYDDQDSKSMTMVLSYKRYLDSDNLEPTLKNLGLTEGQRSYEKTIDYNRINNSSFAIGLLDGLLATDGNVNLKSNHPQLRWTTTSKKLALTIRNILLYVGCHGFITDSFDDSGTINGRKIKRNHTKYTITISGESFRSYANKTHLNSLHPKKYDLIKKALTDFRLSGNRWCASVVSIESHSTSDVYDLYCKESDTWITEGYVQRGCGEQLLPVDGVCLLGSLNLVHFVDTEKKDWLYDKLKEHIHIAVRLLDNVNDISNVPLPEQKKDMLNKRRIGLGIMGYASALMMARISYGSKKSLEMTENLMSFIVNEAYVASSNIAKEKGSFKLYDEKLFLDSHFVKSALTANTIKAIRKNGLRNSHLCSIQPTGNSSITANLVSGGCEPVFFSGYYRTFIVNHKPDDLVLPLNIDFKNKKCKDIGQWSWGNEGSDNILITKFNNEVYKIDSNRGLTKEQFVEDYSTKWLKDKDLWNKDASWAKFAMDLSIDDHINILSIMAKYVCSAISKTLNFSKDYDYEEFKKVYIKSWKKGIKGVTTYREGTMTNVLSTTSSDSQPSIVQTNAPKRPKQLPCEINHTNVQGKSYFVLLGLLDDGKPYEIFAGKNGIIDNKYTHGVIEKLARPKCYRLKIDDEVILQPITLSCSDDEEILTRMISTGLRHGVPINFLVDQLNKVHGDMSSFAKGLSRILKKHIKENTESTNTCPECNKKLIYVDGCCSCVSDGGCGYTACF